MSGRLTRHAIADKSNKGYIARVKTGALRLDLDIPYHKQGKARLPECGLIAYLLHHDATYKAARRGIGKIREINQVRRMGIYKRGARRLQVIELLERRERVRQRTARGEIMSDSEIADIAGVSRQCVGQHKKRLGYT